MILTETGLGAAAVVVTTPLTVAPPVTLVGFRVTLFNDKSASGGRRTGVVFGLTWENAVAAIASSGAMRLHRRLDILASVMVSSRKSRNVTRGATMQHG